MKRPFRIRTRLFCTALGSALCTWNAVCSNPVQVRGIEGRLAIYAATNAPLDVVAWLPADTVLTVNGPLTEKSWVCVYPPDRVCVWMYRDLVRNGRVIVDHSQVRAGAGMTFRPVASLNSRAPVEVRGIYGDWLKIRPPDTLRFWVLRDQVEPLAVEASPAEAETAPVPNMLTDMLNALTNSTPSATDTPLARPSAQHAGDSSAGALSAPPVVPQELSGYALESVPGQGEHVVLKGTLDWAAMESVSAPFSLVAVQQPGNGDTVPICLLLAPESVYGPYIGMAMTVEGTRWFVKGSALPLVVPASFHISD